MARDWINARKTREGYCIDPLRIAGIRKPSDPMAKHNAKRMKQHHKTYELWKAGKYILSTHRS